MTRLTSENLDEIRKRAEAATGGPWELDEADKGLWNNGGYNFLGGLSSFYDNDATFIANARQDVPALLAEVERLKERELNYRRMLIRIREEHLRFGSEIDLDVFRLLYTKDVR